MRHRFVVPALVALGLAMFGRTHEADACGACIAPPTESTVVTGHRMALSISPEQTVLWDQIEYTGSPGSFAWVLPVKPGAIIQVSSDAWFDTLDATTTTQIRQPRVVCQNQNSGCNGDPVTKGVATAEADSGSCFLCDGASNGGFGSAPPPVTVVSRGTVGPYSMVTLATDTPGVLNTWLTENGFALDPATQPVVDAYVAEGFDFIALKLLPDIDVKAMKPVRVIQPGANPTLPLRMVAIGAGPKVALTLFVISEGRWEAENFGNTLVPADILAWDFKDDSSNYSEVREKVLAQQGGALWLTAFAFQGALLSPIVTSNGIFGQSVRSYTVGDSFMAANTIGSAYVRQGISNGDTMDESCIQAMGDIASSTLMVKNPCPMDKPWNDPSCGFAKAGEIDARSLICGLVDPMDTPLDDVAMALAGLHPADTWITRLEAGLPQAALKEDLTLRPATLQATVDNIKQASVAKNPEVVCGGSSAFVVPGVGPSRTGPRGPENLIVITWFGLALVAAMTRRRRVFA